MKNIKISNKKAIIYIAILLILLLILSYISIHLVQSIKETKRKKILSTYVAIKDNQEQIIEDNSEISIEKLEEESKQVENKNTENKKESVSNEKIENTNAYYIKINYGANVVTIYTKDENGEYTIPVKAMVCSTGRATPTSGTYKIKGRWRWLALIGGVYGQYSTQIVGNILFHSVPYLERENPNSLEYWEYDKLGTKASAGCIRLRVIDAKWIYDNISRGTSVEFYSDSNPGPLGKPGAQQISWNEQNRGWDPTDPTDGNPWRNIEQETADNNAEETVDNNEKENLDINNSIQNNTEENITNDTTNNTTTDNSVNENNTTNAVTNNTINETIDNEIENTTENNVND